MKNPLAFPVLLLMASLLLLVTAILLTPEIEEVDDPTFDQILTLPVQGREATGVEPSLAEESGAVPLEGAGQAN